MKASSGKLKIGLVTDVGRIDDGTFNQYAYEGLMLAKEEHGFEVETFETDSLAQYESNVQKAIEQGCAFVIATGSAKGPAVERLAKRYESVHFIIIDHEPLPDSSNVTGLVFAEDQAGFLAGALAGLVTEKEAVGFVCGVEVPPVLKFRMGFEHGLAYTNRRANMLVEKTESFSDEAVGAAAGRRLVEQGADVVFAAAGACGEAALRTAAEAGTWVIGVDQDAWVTTFENGTAPGADRLLTSAIKRIDQAVATAVGEAVEGKLRGGVRRFDLSNDGVGLAPYHLTDAVVPSEVKGKILEVSHGLRDGTIHTQVGAQGEDLQRVFFARLREFNWQSALMTFLAIFTALIIGGIFIAAFDPEIWEAFGDGLFVGLGASVRSIFDAYAALFRGAFGSPAQIVEGIGIYFRTGETRELISGIRPLTESLRIATPYIFVGLAVALGFQCGLFNIGAEGQYFVGGLASVFVGYSIQGLPWFIHLPLSIIAGMVGGALWASIAGYLRAKGRGHEVINTIMLNYIAYRLADYLLQVDGPMARPGAGRPVSPEIQPSAYLPQLLPNDISVRINAGLFLALAMVGLVYWILFKTTIGFEIRSVGSNPNAAKTAGISVAKNIVLAMAMSGSLAGLAGVHDILGVLHFMPNAFGAGYGFDSIALALLGKSRPVGVMLAAFLFGMLRAGAQKMQGPPTFVPIDIISILQALIIIFIAAPEVIRFIYHIRAPKETAKAVFTRGWGKL
ncbi:MAG: BMP family ABC transporter substrate-binding protein [Anaerolineae bacterium]|nr:BMP family ABC transporter substrate-binding protein [Anaerolineae bacterium]